MLVHDCCNIFLKKGSQVDLFEQCSNPYSLIMLPPSGSFTINLHLTLDAYCKIKKRIKTRFILILLKEMVSAKSLLKTNGMAQN